MKILAFQAENIKRLSVVSIKPDGSLVVIAGGNQQGKTSVLDAIWWALANQKAVQAAPIRKGQNKGRIWLELGDAGKVECTVERTYEKTDTGWVHTLVVKNEKGFQLAKPQQYLDAFLDALTFDPLEFIRANAAKRFTMLQRLVPGVDFVAIKADRDKDFTARTDVNRDLERARTLAAAVVVPEDAPLDVIDESALIEKLAKAGEHNTDLEKRKANRERARTKIDTLAADIELLKEQIAAKETERSSLEQRLAEAGELPAPIDTGAVREEIAQVKAKNALVAKRQERAKLDAESQRLQAESERLTKAIADRETAKRQAIAKADLPVEGLEFTDAEVLYDGVPFEQASHAIQLRVSCAIAMASHAPLKVMRIFDGSLLDTKSRQALAEMADAKGYQVWMEVVDESGTVGFQMEDGHLKGVEPSPDQHETPRVAAE